MWFLLFVMLYIALFKVDLPYCVTGFHLRQVGWGWLKGLLSQSCDQFVVWRELRWRSMASEQGRGFGIRVADVQKKKTTWGRMVSRLKAPRRSWWRRAAVRCWLCQTWGAGRSCGLNWKKGCLYWELEKESKRRAQSEEELEKKIK